MNPKTIPNRLRSILAATLLLSSGAPLLATPYASCITNNAGTVSFFLNESADNVKVIFDGGGTGNTNDMGGLAKGLHSFALASHTSYEIHVYKSTPVGWAKISADTNKYNQYWGPSGIAVNRDPSDLTRFGRIYIAESAGGAASTFGARTVQQGLYLVNPDFTDALGHDDIAQTGGLTFQPGDTTALSDGRKSPWRLEIGQDGYIYVSDWSTNNGTLFRMDKDLTTGEPVFAGAGILNWDASVHTTISSSAIAKGSIANNNLQIWAVDGRWTNGGFNRLLRWDINGSTLPYNSPPAAQLRTAGVPSVADVSADLDIAPDGKFFLTSFRASGAAGVYAADRVNLRVVATDGTTVLWDSLSNSLALAQTEDIFFNSRSVAVSPDNAKVAITKNDTHVWIMDLTNGIPDISTRTNITAFVTAAGAPYTSGSTSPVDRRDVAFDAAGNFYTANQNVEVVVVWSPGGTRTAITKSDGTFQIVTPPTLVNVAATVGAANEEGPVNGLFTFTRTGGTASPLTVNYSLGGTAANGTDYTLLPGTVTFQPGSSSTNIAVALIGDSEPELTETVSLTVGNGVGYGIGSGIANVSILDNEGPDISFSTVTTNLLLESYAPSKVTVQLQRKGLLAPAVAVNLAYSGAATYGVDFNGPLAVTFAANAATTNIVLTPLNDQSYEGGELAIANVASNGPAYSIGTPSAGYTLVTDDENPPGPILFSDDFNGINSSNLWQVNLADPLTDHVDFNYDYSAVGIPLAPGTTDNSRLGMRFRCGNDVLQIDGLSVSPTNGNFTGNYRLKFDMWINYNGPMPDGGPGSTQNFDAGVGTTGDHAVWFNNPNSVGLWFTCTGDGADGDNDGDYTGFLGAVQYKDDSGFYAAGTGAGPNTGIRNAAHPFYSLWGGQAAPTDQLNLFASQSGIANLGNAGMAWHTVVITKHADTVKWQIDGVTICNVTNDPVNLSTNVFVGYQDKFSSGVVSPLPELSFGLVDNLRVETYVTAPLVITSVVTAGSTVEILFSGPPELPTSAYKLQQAGTVNGSFLDDNLANVTSLGAGSFKATTSVSGGIQFYRIRM